MSLRNSHAPNCGVFNGRYCDCGTAELWEDARSRLRELARRFRCPVDGQRVTFQEQTNELTCEKGHKLEVEDDE